MPIERDDDLNVVALREQTIVALRRDPPHEWPLAIEGVLDLLEAWGETGRIADIYVDEMRRSASRQRRLR
jgi:hypothetical protein